MLQTVPPQSTASSDIHPGIRRSITSEVDRKTPEPVAHGLPIVGPSKSAPANRGAYSAATEVGVAAGSGSISQSKTASKGSHHFATPEAGSLWRPRPPAEGGSMW
jgi:hypothetical protein